MTNESRAIGQEDESYFADWIVITRLQMKFLAQVELCSACSFIETQFLIQSFP
jgi:hypothetical protein